MKLSRKIAAILFLASAAAIGVISVFVYTSVKNSLRGMIGERQTTAVRRTMAEIDRALYGAYTDILSIAGSPMLADCLKFDDPRIHSKTRERLSGMVEQTGHWSILILADKAGNFRTTSEGKWYGDSVRTDPEHRIAHQKALQGKIYFSDLIYSVATSELTLVFSAPIRDNEHPHQPVIGSLIGHFAWPAIAELLHSVPGAHLRLHNRHGTMIGTSERTEENNQMLVGNKALPSVQYALEGKSGYMIYKPRKGEVESLTSYTGQAGHLGFKGVGWGLIMDIPADVALKPARNIARGAAWTAALLFLAATGGVVFVMNRGVTRPIEELSKAVQDLSVGGMAARVVVRSSDEIGRLGQSFNQMAETLDRTMVSKDYVANIVRSMTDCLTVISPIGKIVTVNSAVCQLLGYEEKELIGKPFGAIIAEEEEEEEEEEETFKGTRLQDLVEKGAVENMEIAYRSKSGEKIPMFLSGSAMRDAAGKLTGIVCAARDMREMRRLIAEAAAAAAAERGRADEVRKAYGDLERMHGELKSTQAQLVQAGKMTALGQLAGGIAHEMNQPLTAILGLTKLLMRHLPPGRDLEKVTFIEEQGQRLADIVDHVRSFARPSPAEPVACSVRQILDGVLALIRTNLTDHNIRLIVDVEDDLPPVYAVSNQIQQVFLNLITNAMEAINESGRGRGTIRISAGRGDGKMVYVSFRNDGPPIDAAIRSRIFDPFFTTKQAGKGMGLGLSISFNLVRHSGGRLELADDGLPETRFQVSLPVYDRQSRLAEKTSAGMDASAIWLSLSGVKALVVDDDVAVRETLRLELADMGLRPSVASSGEEALDRVAEESFDVVLTDLKMPGMGGVRLVEELRVRHPGLPVVAMTGWADADLIARARRAGAAQIVPKPIPSDTALAEALTNCLEARRVRA